MTAAALLGALINHGFGVKLNGGGLHAADHIHDSPGLRWVYDRAERRWFDPYELFMKASMYFAQAANKVNRANDWLFGATARLAQVASRGVRSAHNGNTSAYITKRSESAYDPFGAGHSSTSISAGLGMAVGRDLKGGNNHVVAVIGDGAMSAGMAYEAMNNAGATNTRLVVILNDNDMSIAPPVAR